MTSRQFWLPALIAIATTLLPTVAGAQDSWAGRARDELELTERRIERAEALVPDGVASPAASELELAKQLQASGWSAYGAGQYGLAVRTTLEARKHADRAIAIVRGLPDPDRVLIQVERTSELAERARERLAECAVTRARSLLKVGLEMQLRAEAAARESRYLAALQLTMSARERIFKAMRLCNVAESLNENAARALQRTDEVIARTREALDDRGAPEASRALDRAAALQVEARAEFRAERFESSLRLTHTARLAAQRALRSGAPPGRGPGPRGRR